jgi:CRISPR system Cascade subunit CasD
MQDYLIFSITAPMASFGALAVGERRPSANRPTKSQALGMVAAALGIERGEEARLAALRDSLGFAARVENPGQPAFDYHTTQTPPSRRNRRFNTRADELAVPKHELKTILSMREFRTDAFVSSAFWLHESHSAEITLPVLRDALLSPCFPLFVGRKAHPLMLPCAPRIVEAENVMAAFTKYDAHPDHAGIVAFKEKRFGIHAKGQRTIYTDIKGAPENRKPERVEQRRDVPENRSKWRFGLRQEAVFALPAGGSS